MKKKCKITLAIEKYRQILLSALIFFFYTNKLNFGEEKNLSDILFSLLPFQFVMDNWRKCVSFV